MLFGGVPPLTTAMQTVVQKPSDWAQHTYIKRVTALSAQITACCLARTVSRRCTEVDVCLLSERSLGLMFVGLLQDQFRCGLLGRLRELFDVSRLLLRGFMPVQLVRLQRTWPSEDRPSSLESPAAKVDRSMVYAQSCRSRVRGILGNPDLYSPR